MIILKKRSFIQNAVILTLTSLVLRAAGILFRIWLAKNIGEEGIGLYQLVLSVYLLAAAFASSGICTAVTRLVAERAAYGRATVMRITRRAIFMTLAVAGVSSSVLILFAKPIATVFLNDARCELSVKVLAATLPFSGISSCLRGFFIAKKKTVEPSVSQIFEQFIRIGVTAAAVSLFHSGGLAVCTAAVFVGDAVAEAAATLIIWIMYRAECRKTATGGQTVKLKTGRKILEIALPITAGRYVTTGLKTIENVMMPTLLAAFYGNGKTGLTLFGALKGMAIPLIFFPSSLLMAVSTMLIPEISCDGKGSAKKCETVITVTTAASFLLASCFFSAGNELGNIIYSSPQTGHIVKVLAPIIPFMYLESVCDGMLKGFDKQNYAFKYNVADSVMRIIAIRLVVPRFGMEGFLAIMAASNVFTSSLCVSKVLCEACIKLSLMRDIVSPLASALLAFWASDAAAKVLDGYGVKGLALCIFKIFVSVITFAAGYLYTRSGRNSKSITVKI